MAVHRAVKGGCGIVHSGGSTNQRGVHRLLRALAVAAALNAFGITLDDRLSAERNATDHRKPSHTFKLTGPRWSLIAPDHLYLGLGVGIFRALLAKLALATCHTG